MNVRVLVVLTAVALTACGKDPDERMGNGAAVGAGTGAAIGAVFFGIGAIPGALIGASVGAGTGATTSPAPAVHADRAPAIAESGPGDPRPSPEPTVAPPAVSADSAPLRITR